MTAETLRTWVRQAEVDDGMRLGTTTAEAERIKELVMRFFTSSRARVARRRPRCRLRLTQALPADAWDRAAARVGSLTQIELATLSESEAEELLGDIDASSRAAIYLESGGNPF